MTAEEEGSGFYGFYGFNRGGAAHKNRKAPRSFEDMVFTKDEEPVNLLNLQNLFKETLIQSQSLMSPSLLV